MKVKRVKRKKGEPRNKKKRNLPKTNRECMCGVILERGENEICQKRETKRFVSPKTENAGVRLEARKTKRGPGFPEAHLF